MPDTDVLARLEECRHCRKDISEYFKLCLEAADEIRRLREGCLAAVHHLDGCSHGYSDEVFDYLEKCSEGKSMNQDIVQRLRASQKPVQDAACMGVPEMEEAAGEIRRLREETATWKTTSN